MSNKSPFEIRADLLKQAQEHLQSQYDANVKFSSDMFFALVKSGEKTMADFAAAMPKYPTIEDILDKARELYKFVDMGRSWTSSTSYVLSSSSSHAIA